MISPIMIFTSCIMPMYMRSTFPVTRAHPDHVNDVPLDYRLNSCGFQLQTVDLIERCLHASRLPHELSYISALFMTLTSITSRLAARRVPRDLRPQQPGLTFISLSPPINTTSKYFPINKPLIIFPHDLRTQEQTIFDQLSISCR